MLEASIRRWLDFSLIVKEIDIVFVFTDNNAEGELRSIVVLRLHTNSAIESLNDILRDNQSKTDTLSVHLPGILQSTEKFEQLQPVFPLDADTRVLHLHHDLVSALNRVKDVLELVLPVEL